MSEWNGWPKSNRGDIIRMAREACGDPAWDGGVEWTWEEVERFANLVAAAEREACAKACEVFSVDRGMIEDEILKKGVLAGASMCAFAIRERGAP
jgi:hypothetical protein